MTISTENPPAPKLLPLHQRRAGREFVLELVFRPLAQALVPWLLRARIPPPAVVLANAFAGLCAALALARGELVVAALLLQMKTLLDNADGQLARASGKVTLVGRYLDTEADLVVNAALFVALGSLTGQPWLALVAFLALTLVLAADFNVSELYREIGGEARQLPAARGGSIERLLGQVYRVVFAPQDHLVRSFSAKRLARISPSSPPADPLTLAYNDRLTVTVLANFGLSTQLAVLGVCLVLDTPAAYLWLTLGSLALLPLLQLRRERLVQKALAR
jgi:phosphatidylglycerophosphate synthase